MDRAATYGGTRYFGLLDEEGDLDLVLPARAATSTGATHGGGGGGGGGSGDGSTRGGGDLGAPATFLYKLCDILDEPRLSEHIAWNKEGDGIVVYQPAQFAKMVLPQYYKHNNFQSFVRQLNIYGFRKARHDKDSWEFKQPHFRRGQRHLLGLIRRKGGGGSVNSSHSGGDKSKSNNSVSSSGAGGSSSGNYSSNDLARKRHREGSDVAHEEKMKNFMDRVTSELRAVCTKVVHLEAVMGMFHHKHNHLRIESQALLRVVLSEGDQRLGEKALAAIRQLPHTSGEPEMSELSFLSRSQDRSEDQDHQESQQQGERARQEGPADTRDLASPRSRTTSANASASADAGASSDSAATGGAQAVGSSRTAGVRPHEARASSSGPSCGGGDALASPVATALASNDGDDDSSDGSGTDCHRMETSVLAPLTYARGSGPPDDASRAPAPANPDIIFHPSHFLLGELAQAAEAEAAARAVGGSGSTSPFAGGAADAGDAAENTAGTGGGRGFENVGAGIVPRGESGKNSSLLSPDATTPSTVAAAPASSPAAAAAAAAADDGHGSLAERRPPPSPREIHAGSRSVAGSTNSRTATIDAATPQGPGPGGGKGRGAATDATLPELPGTAGSTEENGSDGAGLSTATAGVRSRAQAKSRKRPLGRGVGQGRERESRGGGGGRQGADSGAVAISGRRAGVQR